MARGSSIETNDSIYPRGVAGTEITIGWGAAQIKLRQEAERWELRRENIGLRTDYAHLLDAPFKNEHVTPVQGARLIRWDPDAIRRPCELIPEGRSLPVGEKGDGIPAVYEAILSRDRRAFLGGEGNNDIGSRWQRPMGDQPGVVETLLRRLRPSGWHVAGARSWQSIRKYQAGAARQRARHADAHNVLGLVLHAYEDACEMLAFVRDGDDDVVREQEVARVLNEIVSYGFSDAYRYELAIVGGIAKPKLEGWILCMRGVRGTDAMTRARVDRELATTDVDPKSTTPYVEIAQACALPSGVGSLPEWLELARATFHRLLDGAIPPAAPQRI